MRGTAGLTDWICCVEPVSPSAAIKLSGLQTQSRHDRSQHVAPGAWRAQAPGTAQCQFS